MLTNYILNSLLLNGTLGIPENNTTHIKLNKNNIKIKLQRAKYNFIIKKQIVKGR